MAEIKNTPFDITPGAEETHDSTEENRPFGWMIVTAVATGIVAMGSTAIVTQAFEASRDRQRAENRAEQLEESRNPLAINDCVSAAQWNGRLVLDPGAEIWTNDTAFSAVGADRLGSTDARTVYHWQFCHADTSDTWYGMDARLIESITHISTGADRDGVVWVDTEHAHVVAADPVDPYS